MEVRARGGGGGGNWELAPQMEEREHARAVPFERLERGLKSRMPHCCVVAFMLFVVVGISVLLVVQAPVNYTLYVRRNDLSDILANSAKVVNDMDARRERFFALVDDLVAVGEVATDFNLTSVAHVQEELAQLLELAAQADVHDATASVVEFFRTTGPAVRDAARDLAAGIRRGGEVARAFQSALSHGGDGP
jgi:hypothetical protein